MREPSIGTIAYTRWAAIVTTFLYTAGYATIGFGLLFFGALWSLVRYRRFPWRATKLDLPLAVFAAVLVVGAAVSPYRSLSLEVTIALLLSGAVYFGSFGWLMRYDARAPWTLLRAWALGALPVALVALGGFAITHHRAEIPRGVGPNGLGTTLLIGGILALGLAHRSRATDRTLWLVTALACPLGILATESRASLVGWVCGAGYLAWRASRLRMGKGSTVTEAVERHATRSGPHRSSGNWMLTLAGAVAVVLIVASITPSLAERFRTTVSDVRHNRLQIWHTSLRMVASHPLVGTGFGTFQQAYERVKVPGTSPEPFAFNLALNVAVETGIVGLACIFWITAIAVHEWTRIGHRVHQASSFRLLVPAVWIGLLVDQLADNTLFSISTSAGLWLLLALVVTCAPEPGAAGVSL